jgi:hypothetical protein
MMTGPAIEGKNPYWNKTAARDTVTADQFAEMARPALAGQKEGKSDG